MRRQYGLKMFGPDLAYGCRMAGACTMTVMRRGWRSGDRWGDGHIKVSKAYAWTAPVSLYHHYPPCHSSLPNELNYLLSLLTPRRLLIPDGSISSIPLLVSCSDPSLYSFCATTAVSLSLPALPLVRLKQEHVPYLLSHYGFF